MFLMNVLAELKDWKQAIKKGFEENVIIGFCYACCLILIK